MTQDLRAQLLKLQQEREQLQSKVAAASARLEAAGVGMQEPLIDHEVRECLGCVWPRVQAVPQVENAACARRPTRARHAPHLSVLPKTLQGFPRADIDIPAIRSDRQRVISEWLPAREGGAPSAASLAAAPPQNLLLLQRLQC